MPLLGTKLLPIKGWDARRSFELFKSVVDCPTLLRLSSVHNLQGASVPKRLQSTLSLLYAQYTLWNSKDAAAGLSMVKNPSYLENFCLINIKSPSDKVTFSQWSQISNTWPAYSPYAPPKPPLAFDPLPAPLSLSFKKMWTSLFNAKIPPNLRMSQWCFFHGTLPYSQEYGGSCPCGVSPEIVSHLFGECPKYSVVHDKFLSSWVSATKTILSLLIDSGTNPQLTDTDVMQFLKESLSQLTDTPPTALHKDV
ncbi:hypothetical protein H4219_004163 [Mycoemilia scoparia]|uniref:Uncharacterized protein n=1 Tax=Mycoemilia scoparia TaxID=417184 RepID=A0A9W8DN88_9FUNG|nr:hypothetical protein H4219_004163 [Mycoemilia scoparia]